MMEKTKIGLNAGKVWRILNEKGELSMFDLCRELSLTFEDVALAIGWLAREDKIFLRKREGMLFASIENVEFTFGYGGSCPTCKMDLHFIIYTAKK